MSKQKQPPTPEEYIEQFKSFDLSAQINIFKWIEQFLKDTQKKAQEVHSQLAQVVKEKN